MSSQSSSNDSFSERDEWLAGKVLGNLSANEHPFLADHQPISAKERILLDELQKVHNRMEQQVAPPLSDAVKKRLLQSARKPQPARPQNWLIAVLLLVLAFTGVELYRSKVQIANQNISIPTIALRPGDRTVKLLATQAGTMQKAHGEIIIRPGKGSNFLSLNHLPQAPQGKLYRLWALTPEGFKSCVHFLPDQGGTVVMTIPPQPTGSATKLLVSLDLMSSRDEVDSQPQNPVLSGVV